MKNYNKKYQTWDYEEEINFNHGYKMIRINKLDYGKSIFKIKVGRKKYFLQLDKNIDGCSIDYWKYHKDYDKTKYGLGNVEDYHFGVNVKNNFVINREFFNEYEEINKLINLYEKYSCKNIL